MAAIKTKSKPGNTGATSKNQQAQNRLLWSGIALAAVGTAGYLGWRHFRMRRSRFEALKTLPASAPAFSPGHPVPSTNAFPLKKGSRGKLVKQLQQALIRQYGSGILPRFGADGIWGNETQNALISKGLPTSITKAEFNRIGGSPVTAPNGFDPSLLARRLIQGISTRNFATVDRLLASMKSVNEYDAVNRAFKTIRLFGIRHTLVTALFKFFTGTSQKETIRQHLLRMGLKFNGGKWSLFGLGALSGRSVITIRPTTIWDGNEITVEVPAHLLLGKEITSEDGFTRFETLDKHQLIVHTNAIAYAPSYD